MSCVCDEKYCTACGACEANCKIKGIEKTEKENGFSVYKKINKKCNICSFQCPQNRDFHRSEVRTALALQIKDKEILLESTSGGAFAALSQYIFEKHGTVYGASYMDNLTVKHTTACDMDEIKTMQGSKYIQSDISECFSDVKEKLDQGEWVLFVGMPCQVAAIYAYLQTSYDKLVTADLICSGVPSPVLWRQYINFIEDKYRIQIIDYKFRDKHKYGLSHTVVMKYKNRCGEVCEKTYKYRNEISFYQAFGKQNCFNDACYTCKYNTLSRVGDFTLGGFWAADIVNTKLNEYDGISLVLVNTEKAEKMLPEIKKSCYVEEHKLNDAIVHNPALIEQTPIEKQQKEIWESLKKYGYKKTSKQFFRSRTRIHNKILELKVVKRILNARNKR